MQRALPVLIVISGLAGIASAMAAPVFVGLQDGNGSITQLNGAGGSSGAFAFSTTQIGTSGIYASGSVEGTPPLPEPELLSNTLDVAGEHDGNGGVVSIYMTETNQNPSTFSSFFTKFESTIPAIYNGGPNTVTQVTESVYIHECPNLSKLGCVAPTLGAGNVVTANNDAYDLDTLVATMTFTGTGGTVSDISPITAGLTAPYAVTEVYSVTFGPTGPNQNYGEATNAISMSVPEPASLSLLATGILGMRLARRRRRRG